MMSKIELFETLMMRTFVENDDFDNSDDDNKNGENIDNGHEFHLPQSCPQMSQ